MAQVRVHNFSVSLDGFGTGEGQSLDAPFGHATGRLTEWLFATRTFHAMHDKAGGDTGVDEAFASNWGPGIGAEIMGRNKFGHSAARGRTTSGKGGGATTLSFILRSSCSPITQDHQSSWGTTFHFIDASPAEALAAAREAAGSLDVRIGGGPSIIREFLAADLIDQMHIALVPILLGRGEPLWTGLEGIEQRFHAESVSSPSGVTHLTFTRRCTI